MTLSSTTTSTQKPWALLFSIYVTQYIGLAFIFASSVAILRDMGMALNKIALLNVIALPLLLKILYAPFIDSIIPSIGRRRLQGRYRSWLLIAQFLMMLLLVGIGLLDIGNQFSFVLILMLMLVYALAVSIQDVAIDGLACKVFDENERQRASSLQISGNLVGNIIGGGLILMTYPWLGWQGSLLLLALLTGMSWVQLLRYIEPDRAMNRQANATQKLMGSLSRLIKGMWRFIKAHKAWFILLLVYPIGFSAGFALFNPLLVDAGWALGDIGVVTKVFGSIVGVFSALSASIMIDKLGRVRSLLLLTLIQALVLLLILPLSYGYTSKLMVYSAIGAYFLVNPALLATMATIAMDKASTQPAKATYFTLQLGTFSFMGFVYAGIAMTLVASFGYSSVLFASVVLTLAIVPFMYLQQTMFTS